MDDRKPADAGIARCVVESGAVTGFIPDHRWQQSLRRRMRRWFGQEARDLPWRRTRDPYSIWVSEIMLQQTQVATVVPFFERFLQAFPTLECLARAPEEDVLRLWEGLGYYRRARQLHQAAGIIVSRWGGVFPRDPQMLQSLPGIGRYTAGAILSIAFDARHPILEANTLRLLSRLLAYRGDPRSAAGQRLLWSVAAAILPARHTGLFNQSLMELGREVCKPRAPRCDICPLAELCPTREKGWQQLIPAAARSPRYEDVEEAALVVWRGPRLLIRQCQPQERWAGLWDFPRFAVPAATGTAREMHLAEQLAQLTGIEAQVSLPLMTLRYGVTRFRITLSCYQAQFVRGRLRRGPSRWVEPAALRDLPLSVTGRKISRLLNGVQPD